MTTIEQTKIGSVFDLEHNLIPMPGFYPEIDADTYHAWRAASKSTLCEMYPPKTPEDLKWVLDHGPIQRDCYRKGDATHAMIQEPQRFIDDYIIAQPCCATKADKKPCTNIGRGIFSNKWLCGVHAPRGAKPDQELALVSPDELAEFKEMRKSVRNHPIARALLDAPGFTEASCVWEDPISGELCKCRPDKIANSHGVKGLKTRVIADIKSTRDPRPEGFGYEVKKHKYLVQAGLYPVGLERARGEQTGEIPTDFVFIAVGNTPPYQTWVYVVSTEDRAAGYDRFQDLLETYAECRKSGNWPGSSLKLEKLSVPSDFEASQPLELSIGGRTVTL